MRKRYSTLQKKLEELESELNKVVLLPVETPCKKILSEGIQQRFVFLKNLLSAEMTSHSSEPHHLHHIDRRMTELEILFLDWVENRRISRDFTRIDDTSCCSCTESCLNDDGEGSEDVGFDGFDEPEEGKKEETVFGAANEENGAVGKENTVEGKESGKGEEGEEDYEEGIGLWGNLGMMAGGFLMGVFFVGFVMVVRFSGCFCCCGKRESCFVPT